MQISLRSQMVAGTAAVVGAGAIALTPIAPAANLPALNLSDAGVGLAAFANPLDALINVGLILSDYTLNGLYSVTPEDNWTNAGISGVVNALIPNFGVTRPGLIPNIITNPFPVAINVATNVLGYAYTGVEAVGSALGSLSDIIWLIPSTAVQVVLDIVSLNFEAVIPDIVAAFDTALGAATDAVNALIDGATTIVTNIIARATGVIDAVVSGIPTLVDAVTGQVGALVQTVTNVVNGVIAGISDPNPIEGVWNALVGGLLDPTYGGPLGSLPGAVINLTYGAGIQATADPTTFVPSVRTALTGTVQEIADVLAAPVSPPAAAEAPAAAAAVEAPAVEVEAPVAGAEAPAAEVEAAPAAEAAADDEGAAVGGAVSARSSAAKAAAKAPAAAPAPAASEAGDSAPAASEESSAPAKKPGRASARSAKSAA